MNIKTLINQFVADTEASYDNNHSTFFESEITIHQLIDKEDGSFEGISFPIDNPSEKCYPERFSIIDEVLDYYESLAIEHYHRSECTIYAEKIVTIDSGVTVNLFIKDGEARITKILDYRDVQYSINKVGELVTEGCKSYVCNRSN